MSQKIEYKNLSYDPITKQFVSLEKKLRTEQAFLFIKTRIKKNTKTLNHYYELELDIKVIEKQRQKIISLKNVLIVLQGQ
jgi:hypothetical protein